MHLFFALKMLRIVYCKLLRKIPLEYLITDSQCTCPFGLFLIWRGVPNLPQLHVFFMAPFITDETPVNLEFPAFVTKNGTLFGNNDNWAEFIFRYKFELALLVNLLLYDCCSSLCTVCICGCSLSDVRGQGRISLSLKKNIIAHLWYLGHESKTRSLSECPLFQLPRENSVAAVTYY